MTDSDVRKMLRQCIREILKRPQERRGPWLISDDYLKQVLKGLRP